MAGVKRGRGNLGAREREGRAWSRALIPFPFPFERLPRRLTLSWRLKVSLLTAVLLKRVEFRENVRTFLSPGGNQTIRNTKVSVKRSLNVLCLVGRLVEFF